MLWTFAELFLLPQEMDHQERDKAGHKKTQQKELTIK